MTPAAPPPARVGELREAGQPEPSEQLASPAFQKEMEGLLASWDARVAALWEGLEAGTLLVVCSSQGDTAYARYLQVRRAALLLRCAGDVVLTCWCGCCAALLLRCGYC